MSAIATRFGRFQSKFERFPQIFDHQFLYRFAATCSLSQFLLIPTSTGHFQGSSFERQPECSPLPSNESVLLEFDWHPIMNDFYTHALTESNSEWTSSHFTKNFAYSLRASSSIEKRELWHPKTLSVHSCYASLKNELRLKLRVHEFTHSSAFLAIVKNCRILLTYSCVLCGGRLKFLLLRWMSASCSGHDSNIKASCMHSLD